MKKRSVIFSILAISLWAGSGLRAAPVLQTPATLPGAMASVTISDLQGFIEGVGSVAQQVSPMMNGEMLKNTLGMQFGDPGLKGIPKGKGLSLVFMDPTNSFYVVELEKSSLSAYMQVLGAQPVLMQYTNAVLILAASPSALKAGIEHSEEVKSKLLSSRSPTLRIAAQPAALIEQNQEFIQSFLKNLPTLIGQSIMQMPGATLEDAAIKLEMLEAEVRILIALGSQCESVELKIAPSVQGVRLTKTFCPKAGTRLGKFLQAPSTVSANPKAQCGYLEKNPIRQNITISNPDALISFMDAELRSLFKEMDIQDMDPSDLLAANRKWLLASSGSFAESIGLDAKTGIRVGAILSVKDEEGALKMLEALPEDAIAAMKLYQRIGLPMDITFKKNIAEYKGVALHQLQATLSVTNLDADLTTEELASMKPFTNLTYYAAITQGLLLVTDSEAASQTLIDHLQDANFSPEPIQAQKDYPAGGFYYLDLDVAEYANEMLQFLPPEEQAASQPFMNMFKGLHPITAAGFKGNGCASISVNLPADLVGRVGQMALMMMQMPQAAPASAPALQPGTAPIAAPQGPEPTIIPSAK